eukprot:3580463-Rhodomonas_salina.1
MDRMPSVSEAARAREMTLESEGVCRQIFHMDGRDAEEKRDEDSLRETAKARRSAQIRHRMPNAVAFRVVLDDASSVAPFPSVLSFPWNPRFSRLGAQPG